MLERIMGLDIGERRVGVALSDPLGITAQPHKVLERQDTKSLLDSIKSIIDEYEVSKIVVGMPYDMKGEKGKSAEKIQEFIIILEKETGLEIDVADERFSTAFSRKAMLEADASRRKRKKNIDKIAAAVILQGYLEKRENRN